MVSLIRTTADGVYSELNWPTGRGASANEPSFMYAAQGRKEKRTGKRMTAVENRILLHWAPLGKCK